MDTAFPVFASLVAHAGSGTSSITEAGIQSLMGESGLHLGSLAADAATAKVAGKLGARIASGTLNYFQLQRLGRYAVRLLRPCMV